MHLFVACCGHPTIGHCDQVVSAPALAHCDQVVSAPALAQCACDQGKEDLEEQLFDDPEESDPEDDRESPANDTYTRRTDLLDTKHIVKSCSSVSTGDPDDPTTRGLSDDLQNSQLCYLPSSLSCSSDELEELGALGEDFSPTAFVGQWKLERVEGEVDAFMASCGTPWALRKIAKSMKYGVGSSEQEVSVVNNQLTIVNKIGLKQSTTHLSLDGSEVETDGLDGKQCVASADREKDGVLIRTRRRTGTSLGVVRRYFEGGTLVVEATSKGGRKVKRFYGRK